VQKLMNVAAIKCGKAAGAALEGGSEETQPAFWDIAEGASGCHGGSGLWKRAWSLILPIVDGLC
jgi:hypothetical protein